MAVEKDDLLEKINSTIHLNFDFVDIGNKGVKILFKALLNNKSLQTLSLCNCGMEEEGVKYLSHLLTTLKNLKSLDVSINALGSKGMSYLAGALSINQSLEILNLNRIFAGGIGFRDLTKALCQNTSLKHLDVSNNYKIIWEKLLLKNTIRNNPSLHELVGFQLVENVENKITLATWRQEIKTRRIHLQKILSRVVSDLNLIFCILKMESNFPLEKKIIP